MGLAPSLSHETVRLHLKKIKPWQSRSSRTAIPEMQSAELLRSESARLGDFLAGLDAEWVGRGKAPVCARAVVRSWTTEHSPRGVAATFPAQEARRIAKRLEFHYTPKHGSWLNMAEIEFSVLSRSCLRQRDGASVTQAVPTASATTGPDLPKEEIWFPRPQRRPFDFLAAGRPAPAGCRGSVPGFRRLGAGLRSGVDCGTGHCHCLPRR